MVRDACALARNSYSITDGQLLTHARRRCPWLLAAALPNVEEGHLRPLTQSLILHPLAQVTPTIEPDTPDSAWADLSGCPLVQISALPSQLRQAIHAVLGTLPLIGLGPSRLAARALAECGLPAGHLAQADATRWLWPEDPAIGTRLARLGLMTFGEVAEMGENALVHAFGSKTGRFLHIRAATGQDFASPIRALYPPPVVWVARRLAEAPIDNHQALDLLLEQIVQAAARQLRQTGLFARRVSLLLRCEDDSREHEAAWIVPTPVQSSCDLSAVVPVLRRRLLSEVHTPVVYAELAAGDLVLPPAMTGDLFTAGRARHKQTLAATRRLLTERHGPRALRRLAELPVELRDTRRSLVQEGFRQP